VLLDSCTAMLTALCIAPTYLRSLVGQVALSVVVSHLQATPQARVYSVTCPGPAASPTALHRPHFNPRKSLLQHIQNCYSINIALTVLLFLLYHTCRRRRRPGSVESRALALQRALRVHQLHRPHCGASGCCDTAIIAALTVLFC
jgi:hypothetical protein